MAPSNGIDSILVISLSGMGNLILFSPTLNGLREIYPHAEITVLCARSGAYQYIEKCPWIRAELLGSRNKNTLLKLAVMCKQILSLRAEKYDLLISVFPSSRWSHNIFSWLVGGKRRIGFLIPGKKLDRGSIFQTDTVVADPALHDVQQNLRILELLGENSSDRHSRLEIWIDDTNREEAKLIYQQLQYHQDETIIAYHPGSYPDMHYKRWPAENFTKLIEEINTISPSLYHLLLGDQSDVDYLESIRQKVKLGRVSIITGKTVSTIAAVLEHANLMISNDSGLMHVAAAVGIPTVGLFGPTLESRTGPWGENVSVVRTPWRDAPCRRYPFGKEQSVSCCRGTECMKALTVEQVLDHLKTNRLLVK